MGKLLCNLITKYPIACYAYLAGLKIGIYWNDNAALF